MAAELAWRLGLGLLGRACGDGRPLRPHQALSRGRAACRKRRGPPRRGQGPRRVGRAAWSGGASSR
eukprot:11189143-Lingulodinium_polyedra.AAC.1